MLSGTVTTLFASAAMVAGHGLVTGFQANGKSYPGTLNYDAPENKNSPVRMLPSDTGFVHYDTVTSQMDIACSSAGYKGTPTVATVPAGSEVKVQWGGDKGDDGKQWPHPEGPALAYMARCDKDDCTKFDPSNAKFFKIQEAGLDTSKKPIQGWNDHVPAGQGLWIQNKQQFEGSWFTVTIPKDIKPGHYLLRHELISLQSAHSRSDGAQYYPACIQMNVINGGNAEPEGVPATKLYTVDDGIIDIYTPSPGGIKSYKIPGPPLYTSSKVETSSSAPAPAAPKPANANPPPANAQQNTASTKTCKPKVATGKRRLGDDLKGALPRGHAGHSKRAF
ncbi:hypothetical protein FRC07_011436 [Ceratobasidium sp. 392]|nr:hypothetical protein FRC07_011436 [Ceratobasidium sp. 392]